MRDRRSAGADSTVQRGGAGWRSSFHSSWIEPPTHPDRFLVLHHVCLEAHKLHFFGNASAAALFDRLKEAYRVWPGFSESKRAPPVWKFDVINHVEADEGPSEFSVKMSKAHWIHGTSFLQVPHRTIDNMFHFHNNFLLPILLNAQLASSERMQRRLYLFKTWPTVSGSTLAKAKRSPFPHNATHPSFFYTMQKLFTDIVWPIDDVWNLGQPLCFRRFVWSQRLGPSKHPYYDYTSSERLYRSMATTAWFRDHVRAAMGVLPPPPLQQRATASAPSLLWISRQPTCFPIPGKHLSPNSLGRCVANLPSLLDGFRKLQLFRSLTIMDDFAMRYDMLEREMQLRKQLALLRDADILVGLHGAGLTNIVHLNDRAAVVELLDHFWYEEGLRLRIYQTMARLQGCTYMSIDVRGTMKNRTRSGYLLSDAHAARIGHGARQLWAQAQRNVSEPPMLGRCCAEHRTRVSCKCTHLVL